MADAGCCIEDYGIFHVCTFGECVWRVSGEREREKMRETQRERERADERDRERLRSRRERGRAGSKRERERAIHPGIRKLMQDC